MNKKNEMISTQVRVFLVLAVCVLVFVSLFNRQALLGADRLKQLTGDSPVNISSKRESVKFIFNYTHDNSKEMAGKCREKFNETFEENLKVVKNYPMGIAERYLPVLGADKPGPTEIPEYPVFVTGFDQKFYSVSQGLFRSIHILNNTAQYKGKIKCLVYDLGLRQKTLDIVKSKSRCEVRTFPFGSFPAHVRNLKTYAFKPIIIQMVLLEFGSVWWIDSMVRVNSTHFDVAVEYLKKFGWIFFTTTSDKDSFSIARQTDLGMFKYLGEDPCKFRSYGEIWAGISMFYYNNVTRSVVKTWVSCALTKECIAPRGARLLCYEHLKQDGRCHRYDQSMLGIIARRLYHEQHQYPLDERVRSIFTQSRGEIINYF